MEQQKAVRFDDRELDAERARLEQVIAGLSESPPRISPVWFYDQRGSALFQKICELPEYYPTRTELGIMRAHAADMAAALGPNVAIVEPGSGASLKTRLLLDALDAPAAYVPVDISRESLLAAARRLRRDYPPLRVWPVCADFTAAFDLPSAVLRDARRTVVYFPGSTLGNFDFDEAISLLARLAAIAGPDGALLLGLDSVKPASILERAYDDAAGVTAEFNLNALRHLNREVGATFDLSAFEHRAPWVAEHARIEMHLVARRDVSFDVGPASFQLGRGDYLLTEYSHKYTPESAARMTAAAGLAVRRTWSDPREWFRVLLLEPVNPAVDQH
ncbi:MAG TPA: L-histidine N(alpha)-methyltransferase [Steroidobacteraceae bacterium]|nr:L-histidine N(alpha)-methyltransferase [Steroidobacteraceae bacterium]